MPDDSVQVLIEYAEKNAQAADEAVKRIGDLEGQVDTLSASTEKSKSSFTELNSAVELGTKAFEVVSDVVKATYGEFDKYADQVRDLSLISGQSAESTSRFIQVLDDYQLSAEDAEAATKKMKDNGLVPTIDTLANLADKYKQIKDPAEKMQFVQDNLGKGGAKWINVLNQESSALRANAASIDSNLVLTDKMIAQHERERLLIDNLSDKWQGLKISVGAYFGQLLLTTDEHAKAIEIMKANGEQVYRGVEHSQAYADALKQVQDAEMAKSDAVGQATQAYQSEQEAMKAAQKAQEDMTKANEEYLSSIGNETKAIDDFNAKQGDLRQQYHELMAVKQDLIAQGYGPESDKIQEVNGKLDENAAKMRENADAFDKASKEKILGMLEQQLAVDGLDKTETEFLLKQGEQWGVYSQSAVEAAQQAQAKVDELKGALEHLPENRTITITTVHNDVYSGSGSTEAGGAMHAHAAGGSFLIPASYGNEGFRMGNGDTASAGERVTITPNGQSAGGDGSLMLTSLIRNLPDMLVRALRVAQVKG